MSASYGIANYLGMFFAYFGFYLLICAIIIFVGYRWRKQGRSAKRRNALLIGIVMLSVVFVVLLVKLFAPVFNHVGDLLLPGGYEVRKTAGTVEYVMSEDHASLYFYDGRFYGGASFYIDGQYYYGLSDGSLQKDMLIELEYAHSAHGDVVLRWQEVTLARAEQVLIEQDQQEAERITEQIKERSEQPAKPAPIVISNELETAVIWIQRICIAGFIGMVMLSSRLNQIKRPEHWNVRRDGRIKYNWVIGLFKFVEFGFMHIVLLCAIIRGMKYGRLSGTVPIVALILAHLAVFLYDKTLHMEIDGQIVTISRFGRENQYRVSDILLLKWELARKRPQFLSEYQFPFDDWERLMDTQYSLVVVCNDGKRYRFPVDTHLGVRSAYMQLKELAERYGGERESP